MFDGPSACHHQWSKWSEPDQNNITNKDMLSYGGSRETTMPFWYQQRKCSLCNLLDLIKIEPRSNKINHE